MFLASTRQVFLIGAALVCCQNPVVAALDFDTYRIVKEIVQVTPKGGGELVDSTRITYELTRLGSTSLEDLSLTLTSHGSYLTVVEEAVLTGNIENRPHDITGDFLLQGSLPIPPLAAVHALSAIHSDTIFTAKLHKMTYSLNDYFMDTTALKSTLNSRVAFLQQLSDVSFEATFSKLTLGASLQVRIAYDIPFPGGPGAVLRIPVLFHPSGNVPKQAHITFFEKTKNVPSLQWLSASGHITLNDSGSHTVAYQKEFLFRRDENIKTVVTLQTTTHESGKTKGNYLLFKGGLNDSLMNLLSRPLEVTFLWRWNPPYNLVEIQGGLKTLSAMGQLAALEAKTLKQIILEYAPKGHCFGLMRSAPGFTDTFFPPAAEGSADYLKLLAYLDQFTEQQIYTDFKDFKNDKPEWAPTVWADSGEILKSRNSFLSALDRIRKGFSTGPEPLRHIEMIGIGTAPASLIDLQDPKLIESVIDSVTLSNVLAPWLGVDFNAALKLKANDNLRALIVKSPLAIGLPPLLFPVFQPTSVEYNAFTPTRSQAVMLPFDSNAEREAIFKAAGPFADTVQLQGIDVLGRKTRVVTLKPRRLDATADSGLARLWAADPDRISEMTEVDLGMRYGILTKGTYLGAGIEDASAFIPGSSGTPILPKIIQVWSGRTFRIDKNFLRIEGQGKLLWTVGRLPNLEVYDLRGRLILSLSLAEFRSGGGFAIPLERLQNLGQVRLFLVLRGPRGMQSFTLNVGSRK